MVYLSICLLVYLSAHELVYYKHLTQIDQYTNKPRHQYTKTAHL